MPKYRDIPTGARENAEQEKDVRDAEYGLDEFVYILHQADVRCIEVLLKGNKKVKEHGVSKDEGSNLPACQH